MSTFDASAGDALEHVPLSAAIEGSRPSSPPPAAAPTERAVLSLAPMMEVTDRHFRHLLRGLTARTQLWTEMVVDATVHHSPLLDRHLSFSPCEHPVVCQLGGNDPSSMAAAAEVVQSFGYDEVNVNCGCPSDRVQAGCFGAALMLQPDVVRRVTHEMRRRVRIPVTVKCRLGADDCDTFDHVVGFVEAVRASGVRHVIVHARKCLLSGLSAKQNRSVPPLRYDWVFRLAARFPEMDFSLNGGVRTLREAEALLERRAWPSGEWAEDDPAGTGCKGGGLFSVMVGRGMWHDPWHWGDADRRLFGVRNPGLSRAEVLERYLSYVDRMEEAHPGLWPPHMYRRHLGYLFKGTRCARDVRHQLGAAAGKSGLSLRQLVERCLSLVPEEVLEERPPTETPRYERVEVGGGGGVIGGAAVAVEVAVAVEEASTAASDSAVGAPEAAVASVAVVGPVADGAAASLPTAVATPQAAAAAAHR